MLLLEEAERITLNEHQNTKLAVISGEFRHFEYYCNPTSPVKAPRGRGVWRGNPFSEFLKSTCLKNEGELKNMKKCKFSFNFGAGLMIIFTNGLIKIPAKEVSPKSNIHSGKFFWSFYNFFRKFYQKFSQYLKILLENCLNFLFIVYPKFSGNFVFFVEFSQISVEILSHLAVHNQLIKVFKHFLKHYEN